MSAAPLHVRAPEGVPDSRGLNLFEADPSYRGLLELHLESKLCAHLLPHFTQLGAMAGAELDELALAADKRPSVLNGQKIEKDPSYRKLEEVAFGNATRVLSTFAGPHHLASLLHTASADLRAAGVINVEAPPSIPSTEWFGFLQRLAAPHEPRAAGAHAVSAAHASGGAGARACRLR